MPVASGRVTGRRSSAGGGARSTGTVAATAIVAQAIERSTEPVDDATEQPRSHAHVQRLAGRLHDVIGPDADHVAQGEGDDFTGAETHDLRVERLASPPDPDHLADAGARQRRAYGQPGHGAHAARRYHRRGSRQLGAQRLEIHGRQHNAPRRLPGNKAKIRPNGRDVVFCRRTLAVLSARGQRRQGPYSWSEAMKTTQTKPRAKQRWWGLAVALGCLVLSACQASVQGDASLKTGKDPDAPLQQFDRPLEAPAVKAEPVSDSSFQVEEYALLGARHDLSYAGPSRASCQCLAVTLSDRVDDPAFQWELGAPRLEPTTQWVIAFSSNGVSCDATPPGTLGASYQGYGVEGNDVVVYVEALGEGRPMTSGAIIPRPQAEASCTSSLPGPSTASRSKAKPNVARCRRPPAAAERPSTAARSRPRQLRSRSRHRLPDERPSGPARRVARRSRNLGKVAAIALREAAAAVASAPPPGGELG